jgi:hypothetical protein
MNWQFKGSGDLLDGNERVGLFYRQSRTCTRCGWQVIADKSTFDS